jgi:hypothetical protein
MGAGNSFRNIAYGMGEMPSKEPIVLDYRTDAASPSQPLMDMNMAVDVNLGVLKVMMQRADAGRQSSRHACSRKGATSSVHAKSALPYIQIARRASGGIWPCSVGIGTKRRPPHMEPTRPVLVMPR